MKTTLNKGFSLIEISLSVVLLSILFTIVVNNINLREIVTESQDRQIQANALTIYQALEQYALKNNAYPSDIVNMLNGSSRYICKTSATSCVDPTQINLSSILVPTYLAKIPEYSNDTNNSGFYIVKDTNGKIGIGGVKQIDNTTFVEGITSQSFVTNPTIPTPE
ncbi:MAG: hypothetical protein RLZZ223_58 [Candidatus Parcubacteria bacterium]|jgi:prepilin-type N-terminal cleavage/methylation domain-containing protein